MHVYFLSYIVFCTYPIYSSYITMLLVQTTRKSEVTPLAFSFGIYHVYLLSSSRSITVLYTYDKSLSTFLKETYLHFITYMVYIIYGIAKSFHEEVIACIRFIVYCLYLSYLFFLHRNVISTNNKKKRGADLAFSFGICHVYDF